MVGIGLGVGEATVGSVKNSAVRLSVCIQYHSIARSISNHIEIFKYPYIIYICSRCSKYIWLVVWNIFYFSILYGIILPIDFHIFKMVETTNQYMLQGALFSFDFAKKKISAQVTVKFMTEGHCIFLTHFKKDPMGSENPIQSSIRSTFIALKWRKMKRP